MGAVIKVVVVGVGYIGMIGREWLFGVGLLR